MTHTLLAIIGFAFSATVEVNYTFIQGVVDVIVGIIIMDVFGSCIVERDMFIYDITSKTIVRLTRGVMIVSTIRVGVDISRRHTIWRVSTFVSDAGKVDIRRNVFIGRLLVVIIDLVRRTRTRAFQ